MPQIIVTALGDPAPQTGETEVMLRERLSSADFDSELFAKNLLERLEWAVADATDRERRGLITGRVKPEPVTEQPTEAIERRDPEPVGV